MAELAHHVQRQDAGPLLSWAQVYFCSSMQFTGAPIHHEGSYNFHRLTRFNDWHFRAVSENPEFATGAELNNLHCVVVPSLRKQYPYLATAACGEAARKAMQDIALEPAEVERAFQASLAARGARTPEEWKPIEYFHTQILRPVYLALRERGLSHLEIIR